MSAFILFLLMIYFSSASNLNAPRLQSIGTPTASPTATALPVARLEYPTTGQALQGKVSILGNTAVPGFLWAELTFSYANDPTETQFLILQSHNPSTDQSLGEWDTTTITDGDYNLRLTIYLENGEQQMVTISGLRVRNYTPIETDTPMPTLTPAPGATATPTPSPAPTLTPVPPTATPFPANPAMIGRPQILSSLILGVMFSGSVFLVGGLLFGISRLRKPR